MLSNPGAFATIDSVEQLFEKQKHEKRELEFTYINLFIEETKHVFDDP